MDRDRNKICGHLPSDIGELTSLIGLWLHKKNFSGAIPSNLVNLTNLSFLSLKENNFTTDVPLADFIVYRKEIQDFLAALRTSPP